MKRTARPPGPTNGDMPDLIVEKDLTLGQKDFACQICRLRNRQGQKAILAAPRGPALVLMAARDRLGPLDRYQLLSDLMRH